MQLGENIKKLGFGLMRLPKNDDVIDIEQVKDMVDGFIEEGFTYFDTARNAKNALMGIKYKH